MRKFKFFALAFAALSFAACSDDAIDGQGGNTGTTGDGTPAYLTISFSANSGSSSRSTADDANNNGDDHSTDEPGNGEDSGHHNDGTAAERAVDRVLVVIVPADGGNVNFAKLYSTTVSGTATDEEDEFTIVDQAGGTYVNNASIQLATGRYNVIVVANPVVDLITGISGGDLNAGIENSNTVEDLYTRITTGNYNPSAADYANIAAGNPLTTGTNFRVMMANKGLTADNSTQAYTVELTEENIDPDNPKVANIEVERVLSKVTFRETNSNIYEIHPKVGAVRAEKVEGAVQQGDAWVKTTLNVAFDALENEVYVWVQENEDTGERTYSIYKEDGTTDEVVGEPGLTKYSPLTKKAMDEFAEGDESTHYAVADVSNPMASITYKPDDSVTPEQTWYVRLEGYALVNLSKNVHYVRHTISQTGGETPFGLLNGSNYLYTPYWGEKNGITFEENGDFPTGTTTDAWFYNTLANVATESENMTINAAGEFKLGETTDDAIYYKPMSSLGSDADGTVTGDDHYETVPPTENPNVGKFMAYCFENSTDLDHQTHGLSTGISFVARMYKELSADGTVNESTAVQRLYRYGNNNLFESLAAIQQAFGESFMSDAFNELVEREDELTSIEDIEEALKELAEADDGGEQIELYNGNICYYYTTEIKHFDNGDNSVLGNMEFAIMRNNIYSLAVTGINMIGDPAVVPTPGTPDENPTPEEARLDVQVEILPWIVRYNDIEF